jgi:hypothetical protein
MKAVSRKKGGDGDESEMSKLYCINAEQANTIAQLRRMQDPAKSQRRAGWKGQKRGADGQPQAMQEAQPLRKRVFVLEVQAHQPNASKSIPSRRKLICFILPGLHQTRTKSHQYPKPIVYGPGRNHTAQLKMLCSGTR